MDALLHLLMALLTGLFGLTLTPVEVTTDESATVVDSRNPYGLPDCPTEDSDNCFWDGQVRGNRTGVSFYVIDGEVTVTEGEPVPPPWDGLPECDEDVSFDCVHWSTVPGESFYAIGDEVTFLGEA